ncbi:GntR family transcriptional regulator [Paracoccus binzhouensis]|uniref:GntR family transcriptional regulator n=1 Tax=Paracoccus binzhouensis TaxID=2796149 RepID=UPI001E585082|nr:GntR family transcriptional regulator [Paracoccus binzhouensis]
MDDMLNTRALAALTRALRQGELRAGQFLSMPQLVDILKLPLAAVREAARHASSSGWLEIIPKRGVQILEARPEVIRDSLDLRMVLDQEGARRRISNDARPESLPALRQAHEQMLAAARGAPAPELSPRAIKVDLSLHDFLAEGLDNPLLRASYDANRIRIAIIQRARPFVQERIRSAMEEHLAIIDALERRDAPGAVEAIAHHCERTQHWWGVLTYRQAD